MLVSFPVGRLLSSSFLQLLTDNSFQPSNCCGLLQYLVIIGYYPSKEWSSVLFLALHAILDHCSSSMPLIQSLSRGFPLCQILNLLPLSFVLEDDDFGEQFPSKSKGLQIDITSRMVRDNCTAEKLVTLSHDLRQALKRVRRSKHTLINLARSDQLSSINNGTKRCATSSSLLLATRVIFFHSPSSHCTTHKGKAAWHPHFIARPGTDLVVCVIK